MVEIRECIAPSRSDSNNACDVFGNLFLFFFHRYKGIPITCMNFLGEFLLEISGKIRGEHSRNKCAFFVDRDVESQKTGDRRLSLCGQPSRCVGGVVLPCAHVCGPSQNFTLAAVRELFTRHRFPSVAWTRECACLSMTVTGNARHVHTQWQNTKGRACGEWRHTQ